MRVERVFVKPLSGGPQLEPDQVTVIAGAGIEGDRYFGRHEEPGQNLTLVEAEEIESFLAEYKRPHDLSVTSRNLVTRGVRLNELVGREFHVGDVKLRGVELCEPCLGFGTALASPDLQAARAVKHFVHRAGLRADVLTSGTIARGAEVEVPPDREAPMEPIRIRRGVASDAPELAAFAARTFAETFAAENRPEDMQAHLVSSYGVPQQTKELGDPNVATLLAHRHSTLVAYAQVRRKVPPPCVAQEQPIELHRFYVDQHAHGSGVAKELMSAVHQAARDFDGRYLWLSVWERNPRAIAFYTKVGFMDVGATVFHVGPDRQTDRVLVAVVA